MKFNFFFLLGCLLIFSACQTIRLEKRQYNDGYYLSVNKDKQPEASANDVTEKKADVEPMDKIESSLSVTENLEIPATVPEVKEYSEPVKQHVEVRELTKENSQTTFFKRKKETSISSPASPAYEQGAVFVAAIIAFLLIVGFILFIAFAPFDIAIFLISLFILLLLLALVAAIALGGSNSSSLFPLLGAGSGAISVLGAVLYIILVAFSGP